MFFVLRWNSGFYVREIAPLLSKRRLTGKVGNRKPRAVKNRETHKASFSALQAAMYSASVEDNATVFWDFDWWGKGPPDSINIYPPVDF